jgi:hypothetical protein
MNIIPTIEGATLLSVGVFCAAAVASVVFHSAQTLPSSGAIAYNDTVQVQTVVISAKRLTTAQKAMAYRTHKLV